MEVRYSQIICNIFITMLYSSGMPILYPVLVITVFLTYWIDKYLCNINTWLMINLVLRVYKKPPRYDITLAATTRKIIEFSLILHFAFGFYMLSNSSIFSSSNQMFSFLNEIRKTLSPSLLYVASNDYISMQRVL